MTTVTTHLIKCEYLNFLKSSDSELNVFGSKTKSDLGFGKQ